MDKNTINKLLNDIYKANKGLTESNEAKKYLFNDKEYFYTINHYFNNSVGAYVVVKARVSKNMVYKITIYRDSYTSFLYGERLDTLKQAKLNKELPAPIKASNKEVK